MAVVTSGLARTGVVTTAGTSEFELLPGIEQTTVPSASETSSKLLLYGFSRKKGTFYLFFVDLFA